VSVSAKVTKDKTSVVLGAIEKIAQRLVLVGIPSETTERKDGEPINNATIGYIQENGAPAMNIPPRPFLVPGVADQSDRITEQLKKASQAQLDGNDARATQALNRAGLIGQSGARSKIQSGPFVPLKPSTLAARRRRGREGTKPLIDTGQLRNSLTYVIRDKKKG
jgi:phage gpG-like protein